MKVYIGTISVVKVEDSPDGVFLLSTQEDLVVGVFSTLDIAKEHIAVRTECIITEGKEAPISASVAEFVLDDVSSGPMVYQGVPAGPLN